MRTIIIVSAILIVGLILFAAIRSKASNNNDSKNNSGCPSTFAIHGAAGLVTTTYTTQNGRYFSQVTGGVAGYSGQLPQKEITQADFLAACKAYQNPVNPQSSSPQ